MIDVLISDILVYIKYLKDNCGLNITVHGVVNEFHAIKHRFAEYTIHDNPYCLGVKSSREAWNKCISSHKKVKEKSCEGPFFGMCHAGVCEYVFPINSKENTFVGFISISGYKGQFEKAEVRIRAVAKKYIHNYSDLLLLYNNMEEKTKDINEISITVKPLVYMLSQLYDTSLELYPKKKADYSHDYIYSFALSYIKRYYAQDIKVIEIANMCHCSTSSLSHIFKKFCGISIMSYVTKLRIENAKELLCGSHFQIAEISAMVGFSDSNYFSYVFKKSCGLSPVKYRQLHKK